MNCRLLYLVGQLGPGGLERQLCHLLQAIDRRRYRPAVAVWGGSRTDVYVSTIEALGVPVHVLPQNGSASSKLGAFSRLVRQLAPDVVHSYSFYTNFAAQWGVIGTPSVAVGSVRCEFALAIKDSGPWLGRASARWPRHQIFNNASAAEACRQASDIFAPRSVTVVRNGLDMERFSMAPPGSSSTVRIVGVGSLLPVKRWDRLCHVAAALKRRDFDFLIQIAGDGPLRASLEQQARELDVADRIEFCGHTGNVPALLSQANFLVHVSDSEGCPNAVMEAMACGRAVVATDVGDVPWLVEDGTTGFVVRRGDDAALQAAVERLIADDSLSHRMGEAGRAKAEQEFGLDRLVSQTLDAYRAAGWKDT